MSWGFLGKVGGAIKKGVVGVGHAAGKVLSNPIVQTASAFIPGVGPLITAGEGALGGLLKPGGNLGQAVKGGIQGGLAGAAGGSIRKLGTGIVQNGIGATLKSAGGDLLKSRVLGGGLKPTGTFAGSAGGEYGNIIDYDAGGNPIYAGDESGGGGWQDAILGGVRKLGSGVLNAATHGGANGIGLGDVALGGLAGYQAINAANASKRAGQLSDKAIGLAESRWNGAEPLRTAGQARLLNPTRPDLTSVYQDTQNPFAARPAPSSQTAGGLDAMMRQLGQPPMQTPDGAAGLIRKLKAG